ncbi:hypothetical protein BDA99DRAFT_545953 [Phascolomyces articulosus]|uniref:Uncharacterized protein n=1 Tax=Phascolomyces articulosus TaxID=60185 RepID=A0AAD5K6S4_9FUNG|nr:hypothetical protein BDA99DRAFT_545953 [Phascolomyces articulosus]
MSNRGSSVVVISGGTACNHIARAFHDSVTNDVCYILGISDNGGSSSELLRVLGGPSIGDLRSRLTRLIDIAHSERSSPERIAMRDLLSYRLPADASEQEVKDEWISIVEGRHELWKPISNEKKEAIRGFLTSFHFEVLKRAHKRFNFRNGSIGNFFLTGARLFFGSLEAALFLFSAITGISERTTVVPVINTNHTATIAAKLMNGDTLAGQNEISHPPSKKNGGYHNGVRPATPGCRWTRPNPIDAFSHLALDNEDDQAPLSPDVGGSSANLFFSKDEVHEKLSSRIERLYYINQYGQEIYPFPNPKVISHMSTKGTLIYSIGSLYTSIVPCLILRDVGNSIAHSTTLKNKILLLNGSNDRETDGYTAMDFINTITAALNQSRNIDARRAFYQNFADGSIENNVHHLTAPGSNTTSLLSEPPSLAGTPPHHYPPFPDHQFTPDPPSAFITHVIYLKNSAVHVDVKAIESNNIRCIPIRGVESSNGLPVYDEFVLSETIRDIIQE